MASFHEKLRQLCPRHFVTDQGLQLRSRKADNQSRIFGDQNNFRAGIVFDLFSHRIWRHFYFIEIEIHLGQSCGICAMSFTYVDV
tara:strand:- start:56 stop:310 length:255 start_codon:yes stop_codon:yes gene_type:complete